MKNLAKNPECDKFILKELQRCSIPRYKIPPEDTEVPYTVIGKLGDFTFRRGWSYWMIRGPMPLTIARDLYYNNVVGLEDIRVAGYAGNIEPEKYARLNDYVPLDLPEPPEQFSPEWNAWARKMSGHQQAATAEALAAEQVDRLIIPGYHIDTELGLYIFAETLRKHGLDKPTATAAIAA